MALKGNLVAQDSSLRANGKAISPYTLDCVMFLNVNAGLWDRNTVPKRMGQHNRYHITKDLIRPYYL
jgi:hypothetical protein